MELREKIWNLLIPVCEDAYSAPAEDCDRLTNAILDLPEIKGALERSRASFNAGYAEGYDEGRAEEA